jgi:hypothetical protein
MRKRNYVMGLVGVLAISIVLPAAAHAAIQSSTIAVKVTGTKQDKKVRGGVGLDLTTDTIHTFPDPALQPTLFATVDFPRDWKFDGGTLPTCNPTTLLNTTTDQAKAACPGKRIIGTGDASTCNAAGTCGSPVTGGPPGYGGVVTAFNGVRSGSSLGILLHTRLAAGATLVLNGQLVTSPLGGTYGKRLNVETPDSTPTGQELKVFHTNLPKLVSEKKKKKGKTVKTFYIAAKCSKRKWDFQAIFAHRNGGPTTQANTTVPCKVKK